MSQVQRACMRWASRASPRVAAGQRTYRAIGKTLQDRLVMSASETMDVLPCFLTRFNARFAWRRGARLGSFARTPDVPTKRWGKTLLVGRRFAGQRVAVHVTEGELCAYGFRQRIMPDEPQPTWQTQTEFTPGQALVYDKKWNSRSGIIAERYSSEHDWGTTSGKHSRGRFSTACHLQRALGPPTRRGQSP